MSKNGRACQWLALGGVGLSLVLATGCASRSGANQTVAPSPAVQTAPVGSPAYHVVQRGDTLYSIAVRNNLDWRQLASMNNIAPPFTIRVGQRISLGNAAGQYSTPSAVAAQPVQPVLQPAPVVGGAVVTAPATVTAPPITGSVSPVVGQTVVSPPAQTIQPVSAVQPVVAHDPVTLGPVKSWNWPATGKVVRTFNPTHATNPNKGIDIAGQLGQPVMAAAAGEVVYAGSGLQGYGQLLLIRHNNTHVTAYGHNQRLLVREGQMVQAGEKIAEMGSTGTDQVKLHFEVRKEGKPVDPLTLLPRS